MVGDLGFVIACCAFGMSALLMVVYKSIFDEQRETMKKLWTRMNYIELAMAYHGITPLPWEMNDIDEEEQNEKIRELKRDGNIVYLGEE